MLVPVTVIVFLLLYALLFHFYWRGWEYAGTAVPGPVSKPVFISVIVPARNEERHIGLLLEALDKQSISKDAFEVIVVDDYSTDGTAHIAANTYLANLKIIQPAAPSGSSSKKKAIEAGIHTARGTLIVATDADCIPGLYWLESVRDFYLATGAVFIVAPVAYTYRKNWLSIFQALDFLTLQGITAASVATGWHSMCNGANLAYERKAFLEVNGFEGIDKVASGDDMLLMHKIRKKFPGKVQYLKRKESIVRTEPMKSFRGFINQRKRWGSKTLVYEDKSILPVLVFVYLFNCLFVALIAAAFLNPSYWWYVLGFWVIKAAIEFPFVDGVARFYGERRLARYVFVLQPLHIFYTVAMGIISQTGRYEWKGRRTK